MSISINLTVFIGIMIPFIGTALGAFFVFLLKNNLKPNMERLFVGFASGVMISASIWSLIIPAIDKSSYLGKLSFLPAAIGFVLGVVVLLIFNRLLSKVKTSVKKKNSKSLLLLAVTLHNIPEGMAVGVIFSNLLVNYNNMNLALAFALAVGIAIQNIPEGTIIAFPLKSEGYSKKKAFIFGVLSGIVEPLAAFLTLLMINFVLPLLPYLLSFAAGAMIYVVVEELIPEMHSENKSSIATIGLTIGFVIMMILDVMLG